MQLNPIHVVYKKFRVTSFASVDLPGARTTFWIADAEAIKRVTSDRYTFQKDAVEYEMINFCGGSLLSAKESDWKRHRSVAMSAFNEANVALVWSEALRVMNEWFEQLDATGHDITTDLLPHITQATLLVIATANFGKRVSWTADPTAKPPPGFKLTFRTAFMDAVHNVVFRAIVPGWFYQFSSLIKVPYLSSRALRSQLAYADLRTHMLDLVASARAETTGGECSGGSGRALLRNLVEANMNQDEASRKLTEGEILSNIFVFLLAGHETTTHTLCFAFVLLALYPDWQKKVYEEVIRVWPADVPVTQLMTFTKECTLACIRETLRLLPSAPRLPKDVHTNTLLPGTHFTPGSKDSPSVETGKFTMAIPAGSVIVMDIWALHMNTLYWGEDVAEFKPERFLDTASYQWPRHAFLPFSGGARSCIGQRFAVAEMIGVIASVVRWYEIRVPDDLAKMPFEEQKESLLKWTSGITLTPVNARVKLCRRV
ncbi:cytochrome P450 [Imleria badia]|nr:cytochrome P450 [Imleria badia]